MEHNLKLSSKDRKLLSNPETYRRLVGRLIYLTITHSDIKFSIHILSQYMHDQQEPHLGTAQRVLWYLKWSPSQGLVLSLINSFQISTYYDSDWANCPTTQRFTTGYITFQGSSPLSWRTNKQSTISRSLADAEYRSMATTACELTWLKILSSDLGILHPQPMHLHITDNRVFHERTKHIEIDCHFNRETIQVGLIRTSHVSTKLQLADILTKALGEYQFHFLLNKLGVLNTNTSA
ncbi:hypothetical protein AMTRI_Chr06g197640 [Amborella trichopoda]